MLAKTYSAGVLGIAAYTIEIEAVVALGLPAYHLVGLPDSAGREGSVRVRAALESSGFALPPRRITVNLAPADVRKDGTALDLPIALAVLCALGVLPQEALLGTLFLGELGLDGSLRRVLGALPVALHTRRAGLGDLFLPADCACEAAAVRDLPVYAARTLREVIDQLRGDSPRQRVADQPGPAAPPSCDLREVRGNELAKRAVEIAAAGGHNLLLCGPPGTGKSMLARRLATVLPPLTEDEAMETTAIYSAAGLLGGGGLLAERPYRAPHHDVSVPGLVGGGPMARPGEISLAHNGVLFLDELPEFRRAALESMRGPLEDRQITIVRARCAITYPSGFMLVAAMNPCPCGYRGSQVRSCTCDLGRVRNYLLRLSGPLIDRFDLHLEVPHVPYTTLLDPRPEGEDSHTVRARVVAARSRQLQRQGLHNAALTPEQVMEVARPDPRGEGLLSAYADRHPLSSRSLHRVLRVARTIADLAGGQAVQARHIAEALGLRAFDRQMPAATPQSPYNPKEAP